MNYRYTLVFSAHLLSTALVVKFVNFALPFFSTGVCSCLSTYLFWGCLAWLSFSYTRRKFLSDQVDVHNRAVIITGCDTGFGNAFAKRLDSKGFHVFATCLFPTGIGASELKESCSNRLHVLHMDAKKDESIEKAFEYVKENLGSSELWAVVNNAGIVKGFSVELSSLNDFRDCMDVNFFGYVRVTKTFLPLLKKTKGRIINITSAAGEIASPFFTPYTASKHAAVAFTDCLRSELISSGISIVSIEPELFVTRLTCPDTVHKILDAKLKVSDVSFKDYGGETIAAYKDITSLFFSFSCPKISIVVDDLESAVSLKNPYHTYKPRSNFLHRLFISCFEVMPRSSHILIMKLFFSLFFSENK